MFEDDIGNNSFEEDAGNDEADELQLVDSMEVDTESLAGPLRKSKIKALKRYKSLCKIVSICNLL